MKPSIKPSSELFVATGCSHCPVVLNELSEQLKKGQIASLTITNIAVDNKKAEELNIRSVPWFSLEHNNTFMIFSGNHTPKEIQEWVTNSQSEEGMHKYIEEYLSNGHLITIVQAIEIKPEIFSVIISMLEDDETSMNVRIGLDALIENFTATDILNKYTASLKKIACSENTRLQIDALHYIALTGEKKNKTFLQEKTEHENLQVKEAAVEALETLNDLIE
jgi:hypothetical protein